MHISWGDLIDTVLRWHGAEEQKRGAGILSGAFSNSSGGLCDVMTVLGVVLR